MVRPRVQLLVLKVGLFLPRTEERLVGKAREGRKSSGMAGYLTCAEFILKPLHQCCISDYEQAVSLAFMIEH